MTKTYTFKKEADKDDKTVLSVHVTKTHFLKEKNKVFKKLSKDVVISGFRPGKAPKPILEAKLGPDLYEKVVNEVLPKITVEILRDEKIEPITQIEYSVTKVSDDDGLEYTASFVVFPKIKLGDFTKIKIKEEKIEVSEKEIDEEEKRIIQMYYQQTKKSKDSVPTKITDELIKSLNMGIDDRKTFKKQIKQQLILMKENTKEETKMKQILTEAINISEIVPPAPLVDAELKKREDEYKLRIEKLGLKLDDFLKAQKTTLETLQKDWRKEASAQVSNELILYQISKTQKFNTTKEEVENQINSIKDDKLKKDYNSVQGRRYIASIITQQKSLKWLKDRVEEKTKK